MQSTALTPIKGGSYTGSVSYRSTEGRHAQRRSHCGGRGAVFLGLLVRTDLVESTLNAAGVAGMVAGAGLFAAGVFMLVRDRV